MNDGFFCYTYFMEEGEAENPARQIIRRTNAINIPQKVAQDAKPENVQSAKIDSNPKSSLGSKVVSLVLASSGVGVGATIADKVDNSNTASASVSTVQEPHEQKAVESQVQAQEVQENPSLIDEVFHDLTPQQQQEAYAWVDMFRERIAAKPGYEKEHRMIPQQYKEEIKKTADVYGISEEMLYGIIAIENGGGPAVENKGSGALGVAQFLPETARQYGLIVGQNEDQRKVPELSIDAAGKYLRDHRALFNGDVGLTMWSYHAGVGNVYNAMRTYFLDEYDTDIGSYSDAIVADDARARENVEVKARELMLKDKLSFFKLVTNEAVKTEVIAHLHDYSETYVPSILAILKLEEERADEVHDLGGGLKVAVPKGTFPPRQ